MNQEVLCEGFLDLLGIGRIYFIIIVSKAARKSEVPLVRGRVEQIEDI
jgi:hypothetical protein